MMSAPRASGREQSRQPGVELLGPEVHVLAADERLAPPQARRALLGAEAVERPGRQVRARARQQVRLVDGLQRAVDDLEEPAVMAPAHPRPLDAPGQLL